MFWNNVKIAIRNLRKNKLFALINILGLALGMTVFVFGNLLVRYEQTHDAFFANADRIWTVGSYAAPEINVGVDQINSAWSAVGPIIEAEVDEAEAVARAELSELLVTMGSESFYQIVRLRGPGTCCASSTSSSSRATTRHSTTRRASSSTKAPP